MSERNDATEVCEKVIEHLRLFMMDLSGAAGFSFYDDKMPKVRARAEEIIRAVRSETATSDSEARRLAILECAQMVNGRLAGRQEGSDLWLEIIKITNMLARHAGSEWRSTPSAIGTPDYKNYLRQIMLGLECEGIDKLLSGEEVDPVLFRYLGERIALSAKLGAHLTPPTGVLTETERRINERMHLEDQASGKDNAAQRGT